MMSSSSERFAAEPATPQWRRGAASCNQGVLLAIGKIFPFESALTL
jgi:hypothetical protein